MDFFEGGVEEVLIIGRREMQVETCRRTEYVVILRSRRRRRICGEEFFLIDDSSPPGYAVTTPASGGYFNRSLHSPLPSTFSPLLLPLTPSSPKHYPRTSSKQKTDDLFSYSRLVIHHKRYALSLLFLYRYRYSAAAGIAKKELCCL